MNAVEEAAQEAASRRSAKWVSALLAVGLLVLWQTLVGLGLLSPVFFPPPTSILRALLAQLAESDLWLSVAVTLGRVGAGLLLGALPGLALGLAMGVSRRLRLVLDPLVAAVHPLPKIALLPLFLVLFGIGEASKIALVAVGAFFPMLINSAAGVRQLSPLHFEVARNYEASRMQVLRRVILPGSLPSVLPGLRIAFNVAMVLTIATELVSAQRGLGKMIWFSWQTFRVEDLYASLAVIATIGFVFNLVLQQITERTIPWYEDREL